MLWRKRRSVSLRRSFLFFQEGNAPSFPATSAKLFVTGSYELRTGTKSRALTTPT